MFRYIFLIELKKNLKSPALYIFTAILFLGTIIFTLTTDPYTYFMGINHSKEWHNAPIVIAQIMARFSIIGLLFTMILIGRSVAKDFEAHIHEFIFSSPVTKTEYLGGRFLGGFIANLLIFIGVVLGFELGLLFIDPELSGPFRPGSYLIPFLVTVIPNVLLIGSIFFALATLSRNMIATYLAGVGFLAIYAIIGVMLHRMDNETMKVLLDPFGISGMTVQSKFWTTTEMNTLPLPMNVIYIANRIFWLSVGVIILAYTFRKFEFVAMLEGKRKKTIKQERNGLDEPLTVPAPQFTRKTDNYYAFRHSLQISWKDFLRILKHPAFLILTFLALSQIVANFTGQLGNSSGSRYPFTSWYLEQTFDLWMYILPMTIFFGGMLIWKERDYRTNEIMDTLPLPNWVGYLGKLITLLNVYVLYLLLAIITGVVTQVLYYDFHDVELGLYFRQLFGVDFLNYLHLAIVVLLIQTLSPNKYIGFFLSALYFTLDMVIFDVTGFDNYLFRYGNVPDFIYSNLNGYGPYSETIFWYSVYWLFFGAFLAWINILLWRKTNENSVMLRIRYAWKHITREQRNGLLIILSLFFVTGFYIAYSKYVVNPYLSEDDMYEMQAEYEKKFSGYKDISQPTITDIYLEADLYPHQRKAEIRGNYVLYNHTEDAIEEIYVNLNDWNIRQIRELGLNRPFNTRLHADEFGFRIFDLEKELLPGDSIKLEFDYQIHAKGFSDNHPMNELVDNGTCLTLSSFYSDYFPLIGYNVSAEILSDKRRKKYGLPHKPDAPKVDDQNRNAAIFQLSRPNYEAIISTAGDQVAVTGGHLLRGWKDEERNLFHFKTDTIIENEIAIISGNYAVEREQYMGVNIEVYYYPAHGYNIHRIVDGLKDSHDYGNKYFSGYPYRDLRVVEIPDYMTMGAARHFPTTFIWVESEGFTTRYEEDDIDIVYGIAAHENAHHWWAGIVTPAFAEGAFMLTETICQYVMSELTEKKYGKETGRKYNDREMDSYLVRRKSDTEGERSLKESSVRQSYLGYKKSSVVMNALRDYISEDSVGKALGRIVDEYGFRLKDFVLSTDLINEFRRVTPDSLQYLITDMFEKITLYENSVDTAIMERTEDGKYLVNLTLVSHKYYSDSAGNQTEAPLNDYIYVGILGEKDKEIYYEKHLFCQEKTNLTIIVDQKPEKAGIDPYRLLIDRDKEDNVMKVRNAIITDGGTSQMTMLPRKLLDI